MLVIYTLQDQVDASVVKTALEEAGIKHVIRNFIDSAYDGIFIPQRGYGDVLVEESDAERAKEIIAAVTSKTEEQEGF
jgi:hypothetical protein